MDNEISTNLETAETSTIEPKDESQMVQSALMKAGTQATTLKDAIDVGVTGTALRSDGVIETLTDKKKQELNEDANARLIGAMTERISKEKELVEIEKQKIETETEKAKAYFEAHKKVLWYAWCKEPMTIPYMKTFAVLGTFLMWVIKIITAPIWLSGQIIGAVVEVVGDIGEKITSNAIKIVVSVLVVLILIAVCVGSYIAFPVLLGKLQ